MMQANVVSAGISGEDGRVCHPYHLTSAPDQGVAFLYLYRIFLKSRTCINVRIHPYCRVLQRFLFLQKKDQGTTTTRLYNLALH